MKTRSAKNKGKRLQNKVRDLILEKFTQLEEDDVRSTTMGDSGEDVLLSPLLVFKRNRSKIYATIEFERLLELLDEDSKSTQ